MNVEFGCDVNVDGKTFHYVVAILNNRFRNFFVYQSIEACILGTLCYIGMRIFDFPYAATISILIGFSAMIPVVGAYIGVTIGTILIMTHSVTLALLFHGLVFFCWKYFQPSLKKTAENIDYLCLFTKQ